jgi:hypothetical protein
VSLGGSCECELAGLLLACAVTRIYALLRSGPTPDGSHPKGVTSYANGYQKKELGSSQAFSVTRYFLYPPFARCTSIPTIDLEHARRVDYEEDKEDQKRGVVAFVTKTALIEHRSNDGRSALSAQRPNCGRAGTVLACQAWQA